MCDTTVRLDGVTVRYRLRVRGKGTGAASLRSLFRPTTTVEALTNVSADFRAGEIIGLVGGNGAGKTTLMRAIAGLLPTSSGSISATSRPLLLSVGAALIPEVSGRRNAYLGCLAQGLPPAQAREHALEAIDFAGLGDAIERPFSTYSSGMAARLRFAIATVQSHEIVLVDEALAVGDSKFADRARARMRDISDSAGTVVLVSHSARQLSETCSRGLLLDKGHLVCDGPIDQVLSEYSSSR